MGGKQDSVGFNYALFCAILIIMTDVENIIVEAIQLRKPIAFEYIKEGKVQGGRIGNPHIIFSGVTKDGIARTWSHIVQTEGVSDTIQVFPDWRMFIVEYVHNPRILSDRSSFSIFDGYNPESHIYIGTHVIARV